MPVRVELVVTTTAHEHFRSPAASKALETSPKRGRAVALLLCGHQVGLGWQSWHVGLTFDEPTTSRRGSYLYWCSGSDCVANQQLRKRSDE